MATTRTREQEPALPPIATAREAARVELERQKFMYSILTVAATVEEEEAQTAEKLEALKTEVSEAEGKRDYAVKACKEQVEEAERSAHQRIEALDAEVLLSTKARDEYLEEARVKTEAAQRDLIQIERDRDGAKTLMTEELAGLKEKLDAHRAERDALIAKLTGAEKVAA